MQACQGFDTHLLGVVDHQYQFLQVSGLGGEVAGQGFSETEVGTQFELADQGCLQIID